MTPRLETGEELIAPAYIDVELVSEFRGPAGRSPALDSAFPQAPTDLADLPRQRMPITALLQRIWELRRNVTVDDSAYPALAEPLAAPVLTCDVWLASVRGVRCTVEVMGSS